MWNFENTLKDKYPLLLYYHPLTIYRHQVLKQADVVLSRFLLEDGVTEEVMKNTYDYYEEITTHDSSLSCDIYSIIASKIGYSEKAYNYFIEKQDLILMIRITIQRMGYTQLIGVVRGWRLYMGLQALVLKKII